MRRVLASALCHARAFDVHDASLNFTRQGRRGSALEAHEQQVLLRHSMRWVPYLSSYQQVESVRMGKKQVRICNPDFDCGVLFECTHCLLSARYGQLGIDSVENCFVPTSISKLNLLNVDVIAAGYHHSLCITGDGDACVLTECCIRLLFIENACICYFSNMRDVAVAATPGATGGTARWGTATSEFARCQRRW